MKYLNTQYDERSVCYSILSEQSLEDYISLVGTAYDAQGFFSGVLLQGTRRVIPDCPPL
jgi:hypothetical protein